MSKHTPGPWWVFTYPHPHRYPGIEANDLSVIVWGDEENFEGQGVNGRTREEALANARLIAASPTLLKTLQALEAYLPIIIDELDSHADERNDAEMVANICSEHLEAVRAAITEAVGKTLLPEHLALGGCQICGRMDVWLNDVPLTGFCWGTADQPHREWKRVVPAPYNPYLPGYNPKARPKEDS